MINDNRKSPMLRSKVPRRLNRLFYSVCCMIIKECMICLYITYAVIALKINISKNMDKYRNHKIGYLLVRQQHGLYYFIITTCYLLHIDNIFWYLNEEICHWFVVICKLKNMFLLIVLVASLNVFLTLYFEVHLKTSTLLPILDTSSSPIVLPRHSRDVLHECKQLKVTFGVMVIF